MEAEEAVVTLTSVLGCRRGLRPHGGPHQDSVLPAEGLVDERDA